MPRIQTKLSGTLQGNEEEGVSLLTALHAELIRIPGLTVTLSLNKKPVFSLIVSVSDIDTEARKQATSFIDAYKKKLDYKPHTTNPAQQALSSKDPMRLTERHGKIIR